MKLKQVILTAAAVLFIGSPTKAQTPAFNPTEMEAGLNAMADSLTAKPYACRARFPTRGTSRLKDLTSTPNGQSLSSLMPPTSQQAQRLKPTKQSNNTSKQTRQAW